MNVYTGARLTRSTHEKVKSLTRKVSAETDLDVNIHELYEALAILGAKYPDALKRIVQEDRNA